MTCPPPPFLTGEQLVAAPACGIDCLGHVSRRPVDASSQCITFRWCGATPGKIHSRNPHAARHVVAPALRHARVSRRRCACAADRHAWQFSTAKCSSEPLRVGGTGGPGLHQTRSRVLTAGSARGTVPSQGEAGLTCAPRSTLGRLSTRKFFIGFKIFNRVISWTMTALAAVRFARLASPSLRTLAVSTAPGPRVRPARSQSHAVRARGCRLPAAAVLSLNEPSSSPQPQAGRVHLRRRRRRAATPRSSLTAPLAASRSAASPSNSSTTWCPRCVLRQCAPRISALDSRWLLAVTCSAM